MMIILPWIGFTAGMFWLFRQGEKAKDDYLRENEVQSRIEQEKMRIIEMTFSPVTDYVGGEVRGRKSEKGYLAATR